MRIVLALLTVLLGLASPAAMASGKARHVVVIVWDGMRPDFITETNTPTLYRLAHDGVWFDNHHPVYISSTEVNGTAIATGDYPSHDGLVANKDFLPKIDSLKSLHTEDTAVVRKGDEVTQGHYLLAATTVEILRQKGLRTVIAGAKPVALLHDRADRTSSSNGVILFAGQTIPANILETITNLHGGFPVLPNERLTRNDWTTEAMIDPLWKDGVPEFSLLWMNEPDTSQHATGPGSAKSLAAIKNADDNLARVLHALDEKGVRDKTDILLISDHGFSTILSMVDMADSLKSAGFNAAREFQSPPNKGDVMVVGDGGSVLVYVTGHDQKVIQGIVNFLQGWSYTGVIFTRRPIEGAFSLSQAHIDAPGAADIFVSLRWTAGKNDVGAPGMIISDLSKFGPGQGMHGTLSHFDMHNTCIAAGPDFRAGIVDHLPTGNVDVAPTVLWILGVKPPQPMDGRVLTEALTIPGPKIKSYEPGHLEATKELETSVWHQYLNFTEVNGVVYFDEGNGYQTPK